MPRRGKIPAVLDELFSAICHRDPARSFGFPGGAVHLCGRCTGVYAGMLAGLAGVLLWLVLRRRPGGTATFILLAASIAATPLEAVGERLGLWSGSNFLRLVLGSLTGAALACAIFHPVWIMHDTPSRSPAPWLLAIPLALAGALSALAVYGPQGIVGPVLATGWACLVLSVSAGILRQLRRGTAGLVGRS